MADANALTRIMEVLANAELRLRDAASKKILLEVTLLKAIEARNAVSIDSVLKRLQDLRGGDVQVPSLQQRLNERNRPRPSSVPCRAAAAEPAAPTNRKLARAHPRPLQRLPASAAPAEPAASGDLETLWARLVEAVGRASPFVRSYLLEAHPVSFAKNILTIGFAPEFEDHIALVDNARNHTLLQTKLGELGHPNAQFKFVKAEPPAHRVPAVVETPAPRSSRSRTGKICGARCPASEAGPGCTAARQGKNAPRCLSTKTISKTTR